MLGQACGRECFIKLAVQFHPPEFHFIPRDFSAPDGQEFVAVLVHAQGDEALLEDYSA